MESQSVAQNIKGLVLNKKWLLGFALSATSVILNWLALGLGDMSAIQPLYGFGLVVLVVAAHFILKEHIGKKEIFGVIFAISGVVLVGLGASPQPNTMTLETLAPTYTTPTALLWLGFLAAFLPASWLVCRSFAYRGAGVVFAIQTAVATLLGLTLAKGFFGALANQGTFVFLSPLALAFAAAFVGFSFLALFLQQFSLQKGRSIVVVPTINALQITLPLVTGFLVFSEFISKNQIVGAAFLLFGVLFLNAQKPPNTAKEM
jgi:drug/metabolite transporter (DMT)-like permease